MAVLSCDFMTVANDLFGNSNCDEITLRTIINRAYYSTYHEAKLTADALSLALGKTNTGEHDQLISRFQVGGKRLSIIGNRMYALKKARADADYKISESITSAEVTKHLAGCKAVIDQLVSLRASQL